MGDTTVVLRIQNAAGAAAAQVPLANAWVYWKPRSRPGKNAFTLLRTDADGVVRELAAGGDRTKPWDYTVHFVALVNEKIEIFCSFGARPIPDAALATNSAVFVQQTVMLAPAGTTLPVGSAPVNTGNNANALSWIPVSHIDLPLAQVQLLRPSQLMLWPILWELPRDNDLDAATAAMLPARRPPDYASAEFTQGSDLNWSDAGDLVISHTSASRPRENDPAPVPPDDATAAGHTVVVRPREQALTFEVALDSRATGAAFQLLDNAGNPIPLRASIERNSAVSNELSITKSRAGTGGNIFRAEIFFAHVAGTTGNTQAPTHFGPVQLLVRSTGLTPPLMEAFAGYLTGFQIGLVDDFIANADGTARGPQTGETDETVIVDFLASPQTERETMRAQTRVRRMQAYEIRHQPRPLGGHGNVMQPQMPLWMAEFQALGVTYAGLQDLMNRRAYSLAQGTPGATRKPVTLSFELNWKFRLTWDGPDSTRDRNNLYHYDRTYYPAQRVELYFDANGNFTDARFPDADGEEARVRGPSPIAVPFPMAGRRPPAVFFASISRRWGRFESAATPGELLLIEFQPRIADMRGTTEVPLIRGGDGRLELSLRMNGEPLTKPAPGADFRLPPFRIRGRNIDKTSTEALIAAVSSDFFHDPANATHPELAMLPENIWGETCRLIFNHETGGQYLQFDARPSTIRFLRRGYNLYYGHENGMPFFGGPHGYGAVQVDFGGTLPPDLTREQLFDQIWNVVEDIRGGVRHVMGHSSEDKAAAAYAHIHAHTLTDDRRMRAIFQREVVRRYNGGLEFRWNGQDWEINPSPPDWEDASDHSKGPNTALLYPNQVLTGATHVTYYKVNQANGEVEFPRPIRFEEANYGPGI